MKYSAVLLATALSVSAHPSGHAHKHAHRSVEARGQFVKAIKPVTVYETKTVTADVAAPTEAAPAPAPQPPKVEKPKPQPKPKAPEVKIQAAPKKEEPKAEVKAEVKTTDNKSEGQGEGPSTYTEFCGGANYKRATIAEIAYKGNVGAPGKYGCNLMLVKSNIADKYDYQVELTNAGDKEQSCVCFNKIGADDGINGFFKGNQALTFSIPPKGVQNVVVDANTQGGCICQANSIETSSWGEWASTWAEFDFGNVSNDGWSGADASCLTASRAGLTIPGMNVCGAGTCSTIYPGGTGKNAFLEGMEALDGLGLNIPAGKAKIEVTVDFKG